VVLLVVLEDQGVPELALAKQKLEQELQPTVQLVQLPEPALLLSPLQLGPLSLYCL